MLLLDKLVGSSAIGARLGAVMKSRISTCAMSALHTRARPGPALWRLAAMLIALTASVFVRDAAAQIGAGTLIGAIVDASSHRPLPDVVVTATSPALQGEQTVVTDSSGSFRIPNLPPGEYTLRYEADTFRPYSRSGIQLRAGITLRVDAELLPETLKAEEVTVVAKPPTVDVGSARSGVTVTSEFTSRLSVAPPTGKGGAARSFEQLAEIAPTAHGDLFGQSVSGTTSVENQYMVDGLSVGDPGFGYNGTPLTIDFIKETSIVTGGYLPEYGRGGGAVLDVVTKSGSNEFHGSFFGYYSPWQAEPKSPLTGDAISTKRRLDGTRDLGFDLGGPIVKDKLWFYVGADLSRLGFRLTRDLNVLRTGADGNYQYDGDGNILGDPIDGTRRIFRAEQTGIQYIAKLTYSPEPNDRFELSHRGTPTYSGGNGNFSVDYETGLPDVWANPRTGTIIGPYQTTAWRQIFEAFDTSLKWIHTTEDKRLTFDTTLGWHHEHTADLPVDGSEVGGGGLAGTPMFVYQSTNPVHSITDFENIGDPSVCVQTVPMGQQKCPVAQYAVGGPQLIQDRQYNRYQLREVATYVAQGAGHHTIKAGFEVEYMGFSSKKEYPGGQSFVENSTGRAISDFRGFGGLTAPDQAYQIYNLNYKNQTISFGAFAQDSWAILDKITLNAGLRYDTQALYSDKGDLGLLLPNQVSPRVGIIFDPTQKGLAKIFANYATYYQTIPLNIMDRAGSGEPQIRRRRAATACNPNLPGYPASCFDPANAVVVPGNSPSSPNQTVLYLSTGKLAIDPDLKPESSSEFSAGAEYQIIPDGRLGVTYIRRWMNNIIEDMSRDGGNTFFLGNPGRGIASDFPQAERNYDAGIISFTKTFSDLWLAQASYTLSWLRGNWEGLFRSQTAQLDPGTNSDFDLVQLTINRKGDLAADRRHEIKAFLARDFPLTSQHHLNAGLSYRGRSGAPTSYLGNHFVYGNGEVFLLPRGTGDRLPWVHSVDLHLGYAFFQTKSQSIAITADIFNLFNFQAVTRVSENYTLRSVDPITGAAADSPFLNGDRRTINPDLIHGSDSNAPFTNADKNRGFGAPQEYQDPITLRFGIKTTF
jgi:outer membrane receptor protein involved in Fe transport